MIEVIRDLKKRAREFHDQGRKMDKAVETLQSTCEHSGVYTGHGHNYDCYECSKCLKEWNE